MTPPKKAFFSLNVDSVVQSAPLNEERGTVKKIIEAQGQGPLTGSTHIEIVKNNSEKVEKTVDIQGVEREKGSDDDRTTTSYSTEITRSGPSIHTSIKSSKKEKDVDEQYDTSDL
jgi:proline dehydrogenase